MLSPVPRARRGALLRLGGALRAAPRPTGTGLVFLGVTAFIGAVAIGNEDPALVLVFGLLLAALLVSFVLPVVNLRGLVVDRLPAPDVHAGEYFPAGLRISAPHRTRDAFGVVVTDGPDGPWAKPGRGIVLRLRPGGEETVRYRVRIKTRGRYAVGAFELASRHPFGLFEHRVRGEAPGVILVFPRVGRFREDPLPAAGFARIMTGAETSRERGREEFANLREYRPGDNPRLVAWKASARQGQLMVKELEDDLVKRVTIFLESRTGPDAGSRERLRLERAISFAASLARHLARRRYWLTVHLLGPRPVEVSAGRGGRRLGRVLEALACLEPAERAGLPELLARVSDRTLRTSRSVFIVPSVSKGRLRRALGRVPARLDPVIFRADGEWERGLVGYDDHGVG